MLAALVNNQTVIAALTPVTVVLDPCVLVLEPGSLTIVEQAAAPVRHEAGRLMLAQGAPFRRQIRMFNANDHVNGLAGLTLTIQLAKAGGAFAVVTPTVTEQTNGFYTLDWLGTHTDTLGQFTAAVTAPGADPTDIFDQVVVFPVSVPAPGPPAVGTLTSVAAICSAAFVQCGLAPIASLEESNPRTNAARLIFQATVDEVVADHRWKCSLVRTRLSRLTEAPGWGYPYQFALPTDPYCIKVWNTSLDATWSGTLATVEEPDAAETTDLRRWSVEGRRLLADSESLKILYGARVTDPNVFDPGLASAVVYKLASKLAYPLTGKPGLAADLRKLYEMELARAKGGDSQQRSPRSAPSRTLTDTR